ncbi:MAG: thiamine-phosphate kinase [Actinobacteria bacterium]|nr:thiamine-phosphate kinase [Actinomycetota bacterium]
MALMKQLSKLGEFGLIARLKELVGEAPEGEVWVGDDTAIIRAPAGTILFTTDIMVEGVHFDLATSSPQDLGYKSVAVNASDIAAMGGTPRRAVCALGIRDGLGLDWVESLYAGMRQCADRFGFAVVGGDISKSDQVVVSVAMLGNPAGRLTIERKGARVGDVICVTGTLGASAAGLGALKAGLGGREDLIAAHLRPVPRVQETQVLRRFLPTSMIDVSDGLASDLSHICEASMVGARLVADDIPLADCAGLGLAESPLDLALQGGEDYELLFTIPADRAEPAIAAVGEETATLVSRIGRIMEPSAGMTIVIDGQERALVAHGWDHLSQ